ncbi:MAG TPA: putative Ig domain-containing protein [Bacteroidota bacterium]
MRLVRIGIFALSLTSLYSTPVFSIVIQQGENTPEIRTPKPPATPRINGPSIFGVRPGSPFFYLIPATGDRPMRFNVDGLPAGLKVDENTGLITGTLKKEGTHSVTFRARNRLGSDEKKFRIVVGQEISLTPALGWNSWNVWGPKVTADKVIRSAKAMVSSGLINHGWSYVNIDDAWQGKRGGMHQGIQGNENFPDMKGLCDSIHAMGLRVGIYSTPWTTSYATFIGSTSENPEGTWTTPTKPRRGNLNKKILPWHMGPYSFVKNDALQWAAWGMDYLKYDWNPNELPETAEMEKALRESGRDIILSLSNNMPYDNIPQIAPVANSWRTTGDIRDTWTSLSRIGFSQDKWAPYGRPGHWNDPDMLVVGYVGWGEPRPCGLTPDEQYLHITLWSLLASPLLIGCDMERLDEFTLNLLTNDEVLAINQDPLGKQAVSTSSDGSIRVYHRPLEDGSRAVGFFNLGDRDSTLTVRWTHLNTWGPIQVRDVWRQKDLGRFDEEFKVTLPPHGAEMIRVWRITSDQKK